MNNKHKVRDRDFVRQANAVESMKTAVQCVCVQGAKK